MAKEDRETREPVGYRGDEEISADGRPVSDRAGLVSEFMDFISRNPDIFGGADILNIAYLHPLDRAGMLAAVLTGIVTDEGRPAVSAIVILAPPETEVADAQARAWRASLATFHLLSGREMALEAQERFKARFKVSVTPDRRSRSVLRLVSAQPHRAAIIVADAGIYRDDDVEPYIAPGAVTPLLPQDVWVPQVHALAAGAVEIARERGLYVALDTSQLTPTREALANLLLSIDGCGVMGSTREEDLGTILAARIDRWDAWIREGRVGYALRELDELPPAFDGQKAFLRVQMLHRAGLLAEALRAMREEITPGRKLDASSRVKLARIAQDANASRLAVEVLSPAVDDLDGLEDLESALATAHDAGAAELGEKVAGRLADLFPGSPGIRRRQRRALIAARDYAGVAAMLADEADGEAGAEFFGRLAQFLARPDTPDYPALIASAGSDTALADALRMACVRDALQRQLIVHAFELVLPVPKTPAQAERGERLLVEVLKAILLDAGKGGALPVPIERIQVAVLALIERLAADPTKQALRVGLAESSPAVGRRDGGAGVDGRCGPQARRSADHSRQARGAGPCEDGLAPGAPVLPRRSVRVAEGAATRCDRTGCPAGHFDHRTGR